MPICCARYERPRRLAEEYNVFEGGSSVPRPVPHQLAERFTGEANNPQTFAAPCTGPAGCLHGHSSRPRASPSEALGRRPRTSHFS